MTVFKAKTYIMVTLLKQFFAHLIYDGFLAIITIISILAK
jgi:hypothetical protein